ncbi:hypothetical protein EVAR_64004_1 [Eumeta japonica]|uniref:Uncharacterized protein n=1 Tax=Eumeta variegata TaxID=151549 RepID=A0A4C1Z470_EUMVA|nr:hypothetical protein EVAR_64004_1 [Eumeta japonica]
MTLQYCKANFMFGGCFCPISIVLLTYQSGLIDTWRCVDAHRVIYCRRPPTAAARPRSPDTATKIIAKDFQSQRRNSPSPIRIPLPHPISARSRAPSAVARQSDPIAVLTPSTACKFRSGHFVRAASSTCGDCLRCLLRHGET